MFVVFTLMFIVNVVKANAMYNCYVPTPDIFGGSYPCKGTIGATSPGTYTAGNVISGYSGQVTYVCPTPTPAWADYNGGPTSVIVDYCYGLGSISVSANIASASWSISGPASPSGSGTSGSYTSVPEGSYTITWGAVSGYTAPSNSTQSFSGKDGSVSFSGTYVPNPSVSVSFSLLDTIKQFFAQTVAHL